MTGTFVIVGLGRLLQILINILILRVMTHYLSEKEIGSFFLIMSVITYFTLTIINPVGQYVNRKIHSWYENNNLLGHFILFHLFCLASALLSLFIVFILKYYFNIVEALTLMELITVVTTGVFCIALHGTVITSLNTLNFRISYVVFMLLTHLMNLVFSLVLCYFFKYNALYWFWGQIISFFLFSFLGMFFLKIKVKDIIDYSALKSNLTNRELYFKILKYAAPLSMATLFMWMLNESFRLFIEKYFGLELLGYISVGFAVSMRVCGAVESLTTQIFTPLYFKSINTPDYQQRKMAWDKLYHITVPIYLGTTIFICFLSPYLMRLFADIKFAPFYHFVIWGGLFYGLRMLTNITSSIAHSEFKTKSLILPYMMGGLASIISLTAVKYLSLPTFYVPISLVISYALAFLLMIYSMNKHIKIDFFFKEVGITLTLLSPLFLFYFLKPENITILNAILNLCGAGLYLCAILFFIFKKVEKIQGKYTY